MTRSKSTYLAILALLLSPMAANAVIFELTYDDTPSDAIDGAIVGTGTFFYDGPAVAGSFLLSDLTGVGFSAMFTNGLSFSGPPFDPADMSLIGIDVTDVGGVFELIFTGDSAGTNGSLDIITADGLLTHQPATLLGGGVGLNLYVATDNIGAPDFFGDYLARSRSAVPEPGTLALLGIGLAGMGLARRRKKV